MLLNTELNLMLYRNIESFNGRKWSFEREKRTLTFNVIVL
jgi:hypothetical protein